MKNKFNPHSPNCKLENNKDAELRIAVIDECIKAVIAEPEIIDSSSSYRQGYARCSRDNEKALRSLKKPACRICPSTDIEDKGMCHECLVETYK